MSFDVAALNENLYESFFLTILFVEIGPV